MNAARSYGAHDSDVFAGLRAPKKRLPSRLLYDERGSELYDRLTHLDAHYLTRTELVLLRTHLPTIASHVGAGARLVEPGVTGPLESRMVLHALDAPAVFVPIAVCPERLANTVAVIHAESPGLELLPTLADYTQRLPVPCAKRAYARTLVFLPGSRIGHFEPSDGAAFLARLAMIAGDGGLLVLAADSTDDPELLQRAYDDDGGVGAEFDRNILVHLNRIEAATFDPEAFIHRAVWDPIRRRVEMHLVSRIDQTVLVDGRRVPFTRGESIITEHSYKYEPAVLAGMLGHAGWSVRRVFADDTHEVRLWLCER